MDEYHWVSSFTFLTSKIIWNLMNYDQTSNKYFMKFKKNHKCAKMFGISSEDIPTPNEVIRSPTPYPNIPL